MAGVPADFSKRKPSIFDNELTYRSSMLPLGTYRNDDGTESAGWAWPGMITEPVNAMSRLAESFVDAEGRPALPNPQNPDNQTDMLTALLSMYGGNAVRGMAKGVARVPVGSTVDASASALPKPTPTAFSEYPVSAATKYGDDIWPARSHDDEFDRMSAHYGNDIDWDSRARGFITNRDRFVDRAEAAALLREVDPRFPREAARSEELMFVDGIPWVATNPGEREAVSALRNSDGNFYVAIEDLTNKAAESRRLYNKMMPRFFGREKADQENRWLREGAESREAGLAELRRMDGREVAFLGPDRLINPDKYFFSDTGRPSLMGSALAGEYQNALDPYYRR